MKISFIIKAFNEESKIKSCISSILSASQGLDSEIILVDSCSVDRTIEIARKYDVKIIQFASKHDANCGSAVQLGYQVCRGDLIFLIDGDMELDGEFLPQALSYLQLNPSVAGVSGLIKDKLITSYSDRQRVKSYSFMTIPQQVKSLGGGGIYRREAIESVGYMGHQWLESCEELELGVRLHSEGWNLVRLPIVSVCHTGHGLNDYKLLYKYFRAKRFISIGKIIRSSLGRKWQNSVLEQFKFILVAFVITALSISTGFLLGAHFGIVAFVTVNFFVFILLSVKKKNCHDACISLITWYVSLFHGLFGLFMKEKSPRKLIDYKTLKDIR